MIGADVSHLINLLSFDCRQRVAGDRLSVQTLPCANEEL